MVCSNGTLGIAKSEKASRFIENPHKKESDKMLTEERGKSATGKQPAVVLPVPSLTTCKMTNLLFDYTPNHCTIFLIRCAVGLTKQ